MKHLSGRNVRPFPDRLGDHHNQVRSDLQERAFADLGQHTFSSAYRSCQRETVLAEKAWQSGGFLRKFSPVAAEFHRLILPVGLTSEHRFLESKLVPTRDHES
jgi:hypothetical protein